jgi:hypothetical protein
VTTRGPGLARPTDEQREHVEELLTERPWFRTLRGLGGVVLHEAVTWGA